MQLKSRIGHLLGGALLFGTVADSQVSPRQWVKPPVEAQHVQHRTFQSKLLVDGGFPAAEGGSRRNNVPNKRVVFEGIGHNAHAEKAAEVYRLMREWFSQHSK